MEDLTGKQFGPYQITAPLGEGGMAAVYKAYQPAMERYVAVKVLARQLAESEEFVSRFQREAILLAQLQHPHILPVFDYGQSEGYAYIVMPFLQGGTLADLLKNRRLSLVEVGQIMTQLGDALGYAHARGMIHRDVKSSNVLIDERSNCLLTDFGLARMMEASTGKLTSAGAVMGTPAYMSPEQGTGAPLDARSDLYSLGIIFYEMLTGRVPYTAHTPIAIVFKQVNDPLPPPREFAPNLSDAVERVLIKSLAKKPEDRYQTAEDFVRAVQQAIPVNPSGKTISRALDSVYSRLMTSNEGDQSKTPPSKETAVTPAPPAPTSSPTAPTANQTVISPTPDSPSTPPSKETAVTPAPPAPTSSPDAPTANQTVISPAPASPSTPPSDKTMISAPDIAPTMFMTNPISPSTKPSSEPAKSSSGAPASKKRLLLSLLGIAVVVIIVLLAVWLRSI